MQMDLSDLNKVWEVKPLKMTGEIEAKRILENVANQVQPIMLKHKWKVQVLSEFCPSNPSLMGLNIGGGAEIKLRLRRPERQWDFFPYEQILDTMLHELCHNEHGPHNADFYKLLDELRLECEELMAKGVTGTGKGFNLPGRRLGGFSRPLPLPMLRQNALAAAERRSQHGPLLPSGPRRIGGDSNIKAALSPIQAAAMAAERRLHDDIWCGSQSLGTHGQQANNNASSSSSMEPRNLISNVQSRPLQGQIERQETWQCLTCTLINKPLALACEVCQTPRSKKIEPSFASWSCRFCTLINDSKQERCAACEQWRYSYGPPAYTYTPHLGT
ncbi:DNA-dependent metalloprotease WSS1 [Bienertia sinuspersici]